MSEQNVYADLESSTKQGLKYMRDGIGDDEYTGALLDVNLSIYIRERDKTGVKSDYFEKLIELKKGVEQNA